MALTDLQKFWVYSKDLCLITRKLGETSLPAPETDHNTATYTLQTLASQEAAVPAGMAALVADLIELTSNHFLESTRVDPTEDMNPDPDKYTRYHHNLAVERMQAIW